MSKLKKKGLGVSACVGLVCAVVLTALLCLPAAAAVNGQVLPLDGAWLWPILAAGLSVFAATLLIVKTRERQALVTGAVIAGGYALLAALACALGGAGFAFGAWLLRLGGAVLCGGLLGAVMSIRRKPHARRRSQGR